MEKEIFINEELIDEMILQELEIKAMQDILCKIIEMYTYNNKIDEVNAAHP